MRNLTLRDLAERYTTIGVLEGEAAAISCSILDERDLADMKFYPEDKVEYIKEPGTMEGGDVMMVGNHFYIGASDRSNPEGCKQFIEILEKHGHTG